MRIHALLSWFDERAEHLTALTQSLDAHGITSLIAVDGPYELYAHTATRSSDEEYDALEASPLETTISTAWAGNEIQKRNHLFNLAHQAATPGDWLLIIDADMTITHAPDLHARLQATEHEAAEVTLTGDGNTRPHRALFKTQPTGIQVQGHHAHYTTQDRTLWNPVHPNHQVPALPLASVVVDHHPHERTPQRNSARLNYYDNARDSKIETNA